MSKEKDKKKVKEEKTKRPFISKLIYLFLIVAVIYIYARYVGPTGLKVREYSIINGSIPESFDGFSIVQFSDLEIGSTFMISDMDKLVEKINNLKPNVVVFTGDIVAKGTTLSEEDELLLTKKFKEIDPLIGKYSVRGDDDTGSDVYEKIINGSDFKDITNSYELIYYKGMTPIVIYGLDSLLTGNQDYSLAFSYPEENMDPTYMATYRILLAHEPDTIEKVSEYNISLMLSGHSHNSEINIPYLKDYYNIDGAKKYYDEKYLVNGTELYISGGLGTSKFHVRLFNKPSISIYRLYTD